MRFNYQYRTSKNELRVGSVSAPSRDAVFRQLRASGINPSRVELAPGVFNRLLSFGKRGWIIVFLFAALIGTVWGIMTVQRDLQQIQKGSIDPDVLKRLESSGLNTEAINELLEARQRINEEYRRKIESEIKRGVITAKEGRALLSAAGLE